MRQVVKIYIKTLTNKNYSKRTVDTYTHYLNKFLDEVGTNPYHITTKQIREFLLNKEYSSTSVHNQYIGSLKLYARFILNKKELHLEKIERPRKEKTLPRVIDTELLLRKIAKIENLKHKTIISLAFSVGLRVSEVINLKIEDIDSDRMLIAIRQAKGNKDRYVPLSPNILSLLRKYFKEFRPKTYLFNGQSSVRYSAVSCNKIVKKYIGDDYHFHTLRHSSFTSMLEAGTDFRLIQKIAGHSNVKTTEIYTHVSNKMLLSAKTPL